ncbi:MAG: hypothetical protein ACRDM1_02780 [Gaiellaceae bacterium]
MQIPKQQILRFIESRFGPDRAARADQQLPDQVDHEQHADTLSQLGVDPKELLAQSGGGGETSGQTGGGAGGITSDLGSSSGNADALRSSSAQAGGTGASGQPGQETSGQ